MLKIPIKHIDTSKYIVEARPDGWCFDLPPTEWGNFDIETFGRHEGTAIEQDDITDDAGNLLPAIERELKDGKRFWLDRYEHGGVAYSLSNEGPQCMFDTSHKCGFIVLSDGYIKGVKRADRERYAREDLVTYNQWLNGEVYFVAIKTEAGKLIDECGGLYGWDDVQAFVNETIPDALPENITEIIG